MPPRPGALKVERAREILGEGQDHAEHVLGDRAVEHATRVGQDDVTLAQCREHHRVDTRARDVQPAQAAGRVPRARHGGGQEVVDEEDIGAG